MTHNLEKRNPWSPRYSLWVVVLMAFIAPLCGWSLRQIRLENETQQWVPENDAERLATQWTRERFQLEDRVLLTWDGSSINDPRFGKIVELLAGRPDSSGIQRGGLPYVRSVVDPRQLLDRMQKNGVEAHESVRRLKGILLGTGSMKLRLTEVGRPALKKSKRDLQAAFKAKYGMNLEIQEAALDLTSLASIPAPIKEGEPTGDSSPPVVMLVDGTLNENGSLDHDLQVTWQGMHAGGESTIAIARWMTEFVPERNGGQTIVENCFFVPGSPAALEVELSEAGLADQSETVTAIRTACQQVGIPAESVRMSGHALVETQLNEGTLKAAWDTSFPLYQLNHRSILLTSILASAALAFGLIRRIRLTMMILVVSLFAMCCTLALVPLAKSTVNEILIVLPTLLVLITISGSIQVCATWKEIALVKESTAIAETIRESRIRCFLAFIATALCLISLCTVKLSPIWDLGIYGAVGSFFAAVMIVYGLPSLIQVWNIKQPREVTPDPFAWKFVGQTLTSHPGWCSLAVLAVCLGCGYFGATAISIQTKPFREWPNDARIAQDYGNLEIYLAGTMPVETVIRFDQQAQKDTNFLDRMEIVRNVEEQLRKLPAVSGCMSIADYQPAIDRPAEDASFSQRTKYNKRAVNIQQTIIEGEIPIARTYYKAPDQTLRTNAKGDTSALSQAGDELWRVSARVRAVSNGELAFVLSDLHRIIKGELKMQPGSNHLIAGDLPQFVKLVDSVSKSLIGSFWLSCVLITGLLMISLKNMSAGLITLFPCLAPMAVVFGILSWARLPIEINSIITASVALGIMVDGKLRYLNRFQKSMQQGLNRLEAAVETLVHCGPLMCQTSAVYAVGFLMLAQSDLPFISRFGLLMTALVCVSLLTDLVLLPQLVAGPLGWLFDGPKPAVAEIAKVVMPEIPVTVQSTPVNPETDAIPSPHIKPHVPPVKKRRSATRREPDPE